MDLLPLECERMELEHVLIGNQRARAGRLEICQLAASHSNLQRGEQNVFDVRRYLVRRALVERPPLLVEEPPEGGLVSGKRTVAVANALPRLAELDLDPHREGSLA